jgi:hypothetical protein
MRQTCGGGLCSGIWLRISSGKYGVLFNYENHYSARLNKRFFLEISLSNNKGRLTKSKDMRLFDLNENKEYGIYMDGFCDGCGPITCLVQGQVCRSENEWRQLLKPFMED